MLKTKLQNMMKDPIVQNDELNNLFEYCDKESVKNILADDNFCNSLILSNTKSTDKVPLGFAFMINAFQKDHSSFPLFMKNQNFKNLFLSYGNTTLDNEFENMWFYYILDAESKATCENLKVIIQDKSLSSAFYASRCVGRIMIEYTKNHPEQVGTVIKHQDIKSAIKKDRSHHVAIRDILCNSRNKKDADTVFSENTFGIGFSDGLKTHIYNQIAKNYRKSLPDSLSKRCLFSITSSELPSLESLPNDLREVVNNFNIQNK
jgi:hypothetical protein